MSCTINVWTEAMYNKKYHPVRMYEFSEGRDPFNDQNYAVFGFLAGVRNYSGIEPLSEPRGEPTDLSNQVMMEYHDSYDVHSPSWLQVSELLAVDYGKIVEDRRVTAEIEPGLWSGAQTCPVGDGKKMTLRDFLGPRFINDLTILSRTNADRIFFCFDG